MNRSRIKEGVLSDFIFENDRFEIRCNTSVDIFEAYLKELDLESDNFSINSNIETLNRVIDHLRTKSIDISEIVRSKTSLEDYFIKIIEE